MRLIEKTLQDIKSNPIGWIGTFLGLSGAIINIFNVPLAATIWLVANLIFIAWAIWFNGPKNILVLNLGYVVINLTALAYRIITNSY